MDPLSITVATIAIVQTISSTYSTIQRLKGLPKAFKEVGQELPLVKETLDLVRSQLQASTLDDSNQKVIEPIIRSCQEQANALKEIFQEIEKKKKNDKDAKDWSALVSFYRTMMLRMGKAHRVEILMQGILKGLKGLAVHRLFMVATKSQVDKIEDAIRKLGEVEPSLPDSDFETNGTSFAQSVGSGKGNMFNAVGGPMTNKFGNEFNTTGSMNFDTITNFSYTLVSNYHHSISADGHVESMIPQWLEYIAPPLPFEEKQQEMYELSRRAQKDGAPRVGQWLLDSRQFLNWRDGESRKLWCWGIPGAGKTVLVSIVINHLQTGFSFNKNIACLYVYFDYKKQKTQNLMNLLSTLLVQLLRSRNGVCSRIKEMYKAYERDRILPSRDDYVEMLKCQMQLISKVYIVIDALDECLDDAEPNTLNNFLEACQTLPENVHILFTSRPGLGYSERINPTCRLEIVANVDDMRQYLETSINSHPRLREIIGAEVKHDDSFRARVLDKIVGKSEGMFLLAHLHLEFLATDYTIRGLKTKLDHLSETPDQVYRAAIERIENQVEKLRSLAFNALTWLVFAERELTIAELAHAIEIQDHSVAIQSGVMPLPMGSALPSTELALTTACVGIVVVDEKTKIVRLAHNTAETYLRENQSTIFENAQSKIAKTCLTCLVYLPPKQMSKPTSSKAEWEEHYMNFPFLKYAVEHWNDHLMFKVEGNIYRFAWDFLSDKRKVNSWVQSTAYAQLRHEKDVSGLHVLAYFGLVKLVKKAMENKKHLSINARTSRGETPLHWAVIYRQTEFLRLLVAQNADPNLADINGKTALHKAIRKGDDTSVEILLSSKIPVDLTLEDIERWTPLRWAAAYGKCKVVEMLLLAGAEVDAQDKDKWSAIRWAAQNGHKAVVELLINHNASLECSDSHEWTLLRWAAKEGLEDLIKLLVEKQVDLNATDLNGWTALQWTVTYGHTMSAWLLIQAHTKLDKRDDKGRSPLHAALESCPSASLSFILCLLLEKGAKVNERTRLKLTPLHFAATRGSHSAVWLLLEKGADPSLRDVNDRTALHCAITAGHVDVARLLIWKAECLIHAVDDETRTALHYAASLGNHHIVELLLDREAEIDVSDVDGNTPLHLAVYQQQEEVVAYLVWRGAGASCKRKTRKRTMNLALELGNTAIIESLSQIGDNGGSVVEQNKRSIPREVGEAKTAPKKYSARVEDETND